MNNNSLRLFEDRCIRADWNARDQKWYYSVVDALAALTDSTNPRLYWRVIKNRLEHEDKGSVSNCIETMSENGEKRVTDVANTEQLMRIIQAVPSPKSEHFKQWLAEENSKKAG